MLAFMFLIPAVQLATARFLVSQPVLKVVYGNIGKLDDLMLPMNASRRADVDTDFTYEDHEALPDFIEFLSEVEDMEQWNSKLNTTQNLDTKDLSAASNILRDMKNNLRAVIKDQAKTRRQEGADLPHEVNSIWRDPIRLREWYYQKICLSYLIHIRFQVDSANRHKMAIQSYYGYKIGYLFHRLMRIKGQMYRVMEEWTSMRTVRLAQNRPNWRTKTHNLKMLLQLYERMLQLDVDMKDTVEMVKLVYWHRPMFQTEETSPSTKHMF